MSQPVLTQLYGLGFTLLFVGYAVIRRMRPQPVKPRSVMISGAIITVVLLLSLVGSGGRIISDPLALALIPVFLAAGAGLGYYLVRTMTFWTDPDTGALWMKGGVLFALILVGSIVLRFGVRSIAYGSMFGGTSGSGSPFAPQAGGSQGFLYDLSADLLFLSLGLWAARAYFLVRRHQQHQVAAEVPAAGGVDV